MAKRKLSAQRLPIVTGYEFLTITVNNLNEIVVSTNIPSLAFYAMKYVDEQYPSTEFKRKLEYVEN